MVVEIPVASLFISENSSGRNYEMGPDIPARSSLSSYDPRISRLAARARLSRAVIVNSARERNYYGCGDEEGFGSEAINIYFLPN